LNHPRPEGWRTAADASAAAAIDCDVLVVGGGINGAGIARDLAGRGLKVVVAEKDDLGSHTSSSSTKLIHGGLRYLEYYEFSMVRKALAEREVLLRCAPHIMWPLRFVMPHDPSMRPVWMIRAGLFLYDHLARREVLPGSGTVDLRSHPAGVPLKNRFHKGFVYSDGWVDDARLVLPTDSRKDGSQIMDMGPESAKAFAALASDAKLIVWNGPVGKFEDARFMPGTEAIARAIAASPATSVIGGGDTIAAVNRLGLLDQYDFVSTGGGAMLAFLSGQQLPGLKALGYYRD